MPAMAVNPRRAILPRSNVVAACPWMRNSDDIEGVEVVGRSLGTGRFRDHTIHGEITEGAPGDSQRRGGRKSPVAIRPDECIASPEADLKDLGLLLLVAGRPRNPPSCCQVRNILDDGVALKSFDSALSAEAAVLHAAERCFRARRNEMIDREISDLNALRQLIGVSRRVREGIGRQAIRNGISLLDRLVKTANATKQGERPERLLPHRPCVIGNVGNDREGKIVATIANT